MHYKIYKSYIDISRLSSQVLQTPINVFAVITMTQASCNNANNIGIRLSSSYDNRLVSGDPAERLVKPYVVSFNYPGVNYLVD